MKMFLKENNQQSYNSDRWLDYSLYHKLRRKIKCLYTIERNKDLNPKLSPEQLNLGFFIAFTKSNRPFFPAKKNKKLIQDLEEIGFFDVFATNHSADDVKKGFGVYLSQVVLFLQYGIEWVRKGFKMPADKMEIHHLSSNVLDNRPMNLEVVTVNLHAFLTNLQMGQHHCYSKKPTYNKFYNDIPTNRGDWLTNFKTSKGRVTNLINNTLIRTKLWLKLYLLNYVSQNSLNGSNIKSPSTFNINNSKLGNTVKLPTSINIWNANEEQQILAVSWNWLTKQCLPDLKTIYKNLKGAASIFFKHAFEKRIAKRVFKALIA